jgi:hypothetical protein
MFAPGEHKTVQARILAYVRETGWTSVARAEERRSVEPYGITSEDCAVLPQLMTAQSRVKDLDLDRNLAFADTETA